MDEPRAEDRELVTAVLARAPGAFERLVARHQKLVWHLVYRMVQHPEDARDLSQEVFLRVYQRLGQYRFESALATWIGRVAFSVSTRHLQRRKLPIVECASDDDHAGAALDGRGQYVPVVRAGSVSASISDSAPIRTAVISIGLFETPGWTLFRTR